MRRFAILIALMSCPGWASPVPQPSPSSSVPRAQAMALAKLLNTEATVIGDASDDRLAADLMEQLGGSNARLGTLEKESPGVLREIAVAVIPIINRSARERLPMLWRRQAMLYGEIFSDMELQTLIDFYDSPTGKKLIAGVADLVRPDAVIAEMKASPEFKVGPDAILHDIRAVTPAVAATMDAADRVRLASLVRSGLMARMRTLAPRTQALLIEWANESAPWEDDAIDDATAAVIERHAAGAKR